jgi:hypothetical protein
MARPRQPLRVQGRRLTEVNANPLDDVTVLAIVCEFYEFIQMLKFFFIKQKTEVKCFQ